MSKIGMETMRRFCIRLDRCAIAGGILGVASAGLLGQMPTKDAQLAGATMASEQEPASASLAGLEAGLRLDLEAHPDSAPLLYQLGQVLRLENRPRESLEIYTQAARLQKPDAEQLRSAALNYVLLDDYKDAIHWLEVAASLYPHQADILYSLGRCYYSQSRFHDAETMFLAVLQIEPKHLKAEENLGLIYGLVDNQPEQAEAALRKTVEWAGDGTKDEWPFLDLGNFLLDHGRAAEAVPFLERAASIAARCVACHEQLGRAFVAAKNATSGIKELEIASQLAPDNPQIHFELGRAYREAGALDKSRAEFQRSQLLYGQHSSN